MPNRTVVLSLALTISMALVIRIAGQGTSELQLVTRAADALGGRDRVMAVKTLQIIGYGELAYFNGGGNITGDPAAPQKWQKVLEYTRTIDLEHCAHACAAAPEDGFRLRIDGRATRTQSDQRNA